LSISAISRRYAKALVAIGSDQGKVEAYAEELTRVGSLLAGEQNLRLLMDSPTVSLEKKAAILNELLGKMQVSKGMGNFLGLLLNKDRLRFLPQIEADYRRLADELSGVLRARITSALELSAAQRDAIKTRLEAGTKKRVVLRVEIDPALIGGVQAEIGGRVFDGSLKAQLNRIEDTLKKG
jgi:F-type H+-transporting ATPase subunit delta